MRNEFSFLRPYFRGLPLIILSMVIAVIVAQKYLSYVTPMYESVTKLKLADIQEGAPGANLFKDLDVFATSNKIGGEIEVLKSKIIIDKAVKKIGFDQEIYRIGKIKSTELFTERPFLVEASILDQELYDTKLSIIVKDTANYSISIPESEEKYDGVFGQNLVIPNKASFKLDINKDLFAKKSNLKIADNYQLEILSEQKIYKKITTNLDVVSTEKDVAILKIIFKSTVPEKAAIFTNTLAETYISDYIEVKYQTAKITSDFLNKQISDVYKKLNDSENKIEKYKEKKEIINLRQETETDLRKISQLKIQQTNVKMSLDAIDELNQYIKKGEKNFLELAPNFEAFTDLLSTEMIKKIKELQSERTDLLLTYKKDTEMVKAVDEKISFFTSYFIESINNTKNNLQTKYDKLSSDIIKAREVFVDLPEKEKMLLILERDFQLNQQSYIFLNEKKIEAEIAKAAKVAFHRIITKAEASTAPVSPNRTIIIIVSALLALMGSLFLIFLVHSLKARVNSTNAIEKATDIPILYTTPRLKKEIKKNVHFQREVLRMDMNHALIKKGIINLTSVKDSHGSIFHSYNIARTLHAQEKKVLLVSIDNQIESKELGYDVINLDSAVFINHSYEKLCHYFETLAEGYDYTLIKNENLKSNFISTVIMRMSDRNLFVLDSRKTLASELVKINLLRDKYEIKNMHFVLNNDSYNPSVIVEIWKSIKHFFKFIKQVKK